MLAPETTSHVSDRPPPAGPVDFDAFYREHLRFAAHIARGLVGSGPELDDVCQIAFLKIFRNVGLLGGLENPKAWVAAVVRRTALDHRKVNGRRRDALAVGDPAPTAPAEYDAEGEFDRHRESVDEDAMLERAVRQLPPRDRDLLIRVLESGAPRVAAELGIPSNSVRRRLHAIRQRLRELIERLRDGVIPEGGDGSSK
jgi:RNA polymerase sigma factor (sigma-70 family)